MDNFDMGEVLTANETEVTHIYDLRGSTTPIV